MKRYLLPALLSFAAGPALSLSCLPPDVVSSYNDAAASEKSYVVVHGTLTFDESKLPKSDLSQQEQTPPSTDIPARLTGKSLSKAGFKADFDRPITVRSVCFGPWCGQPASGTEYLSFLEKAGDTYVLAVTPCGGFDFAQPTQAMLNKVTKCFKGNSCSN